MTKHFFMVELPDGQDVRINAHSFEIIRGELIFYPRFLPRKLAAFAPGQWHSVIDSRLCCQCKTPSQ